MTKTSTESRTYWALVATKKRLAEERKKTVRLNRILKEVVKMCWDNDYDEEDDVGRIIGLYLEKEGFVGDNR